MMTVEKMQKIAAAIVAMRESASDAQASLAVDLYPEMHYKGALIKVNTRILWGNTLKRAAVDVWDREENNPDNAPTLWEDVAYRGGYRIIPQNIPATDPFSLGECGWWEDVLYESLADNNVYTPAQYPAWWKVKEEAT